MLQSGRYFAYNRDMTQNETTAVKVDQEARQVFSEYCDRYALNRQRAVSSALVFCASLPEEVFSRIYFSGGKAAQEDFRKMFVEIAEDVIRQGIEIGKYLPQGQKNT